MKFDVINYWSEVKLDIVREYAQAYSTILFAQNNPKLHHVYIDAFAGAGVHIVRRTGGFVPGSPLNALSLKPPFEEYHLIDLDSEKIRSLREIAENFPNVQVYCGDCNKLLLDDIFPKCEFRDYRRALCVLDPYGLHLDWKVVLTAGEMKSIEIFLNFPVVDMNRNVLWTNPLGVKTSQRDRMNRFWGDGSWQDVAYETESNLFGFQEKTAIDMVANAFQDRLRNIAGFAYVPDPIPMRNSKGAIIYYLFFASNKPVAASIVTDIFKKYMTKGIR